MQDGIRCKRTPVTHSPPAASDATANIVANAVEPVVERIIPTNVGPTKLPSAPAELMSPKEAAAAESLNRVEASAQKEGTQANIEAPAKVNHVSTSPNGCDGTNISA